MDQPSSKSVAERQKSTPWGCILALFTASPFALLAILFFVFPEIAQKNAGLRQGLHGILGAPLKPYNVHYAMTMLFAIPALMLVGRAIYFPKVSQAIAVALGSLPASMIIDSCFFGVTDACSMVLFGTISIGLLAYGFQRSSKAAF